MKLAVKLMLGATIGLMLPTAGLTKESRTLEVSEATVDKKCGDKLQTDPGGKGCSVACPSNINGKTCDYSCGGDQGKGCRVEIFSRVAAGPQKKGQVDPTTIEKQ